MVELNERIRVLDKENGTCVICYPDLEGSLTAKLEEKRSLLENSVPEKVKHAKEHDDQVTELNTKIGTLPVPLTLIARTPESKCSIRS